MATRSAKSRSPRNRRSGGRSPAMEQFFRAKTDYPDAILFFRMGDFYEMFHEDAVRASALLDIALTTRGNDENGVAIPMAGVPHHAAGGYIARLIEQGQRVAICEQMEDPSKVKGVVPREVVRVVTPGLAVDPEVLDDRTHNFLCAIASDAGTLGLAVLELSTGELRACCFDSQAELLAELVRLSPREALVDTGLPELRAQLDIVLPTLTQRGIDAAGRASAAQREDVTEIVEAAREQAGLGSAAAQACQIALSYAQDSQPGAPLELPRIVPYDVRTQLVMDEAAVRNLEIVTTMSGERVGSLAHLLDLTKTAMGSRTLKRRLLAPLCDLTAIRRRHDRVEALVDDPILRDELRKDLGGIRDLQRLATRASLGLATPRDLGAIRVSLSRARELRDRLRDAAHRSTDDTLEQMIPPDVCESVADLLDAALVDEPPHAWTGGGIFRSEYDPRIAELRDISTGSKDLILSLESKERQRTGIASLKVKFTKVFGYYIEISKARLDAVPDDYRRKQTVANGERFTTDALDEVQARILNADEKLRGLEADLFERLRFEVGSRAEGLRKLAEHLADIDIHAALADGAHRHGHVRPTMDESTDLEIAESRHPIVEHSVDAGSFVPNDVRLDTDSARLMVVTGPNMAGKSTVMRQVALCVIMAQAGCFVPVRSARIGLVDRIYTRVGASDDVARGESTFMTEMRETASILHGATRRSLVILDEIGRGTSTYDGLAIAWAVAEHLHDAIGCRTMFATHYHELCELAATRSGVKNFNTAAREHGDRVVFLRKLVPGAANKSYGVAVAKLARLPEIVLARAGFLLDRLESGEDLPSGRRASMRGRAEADTAQLDMFNGQPRAGNSELEQTLRALDPERMTPLEALVAIDRLKALLDPHREIS